MKYTVLIEESDEGFAVSVPGMPGCHSQGVTEIFGLLVWSGAFGQTT